MSSDAHIFLYTEQAPADVAQQLAPALGGRLVERDGSVFIARPAVGSHGEVGGEVSRNMFGTPPDPEPDEISVLDGYDTVFEIRHTEGDEQDQQAQAKLIFDEITRGFPWPALLIFNLARLVTAWNPDAGRVDFPHGTTPDAKDQHLWANYTITATHSGDAAGA